MINSHSWKHPTLAFSTLSLVALLAVEHKFLTFEDEVEAAAFTHLIDLDDLGHST